MPPGGSYLIETRGRTLQDFHHWIDVKQKLLFAFLFFFVSVFVFFAFSDDIKRVKEVREMCSRPFTIVRSWSYRGLLSDPVAEEGKNINL